MNDKNLHELTRNCTNLHAEKQIEEIKDKLKPCPFCGKEDNSINFFDRDNGERIWALSHYCPHSDELTIVINIYGNSEEEVIERWNRRVKDD